MMFSNTMARRVKENFFFLRIVTNCAKDICLFWLVVQMAMKTHVKISKNQGKVILLGRREGQHRGRVREAE